jgi:hypothetical protein
VVDVIDRLGVDVATFSEFVDGPTRDDLRADLRSLGLTHLHVSTRIGRSNQLFIASRFPMLGGSLRSPGVGDVDEANWSHVCLPDFGLEVVGFRMPWYKRAGERDAYRSALANLLSTEADRALVICGDFNYDPFANEPDDLQDTTLLGLDGFRVVRSNGGWSYINSAGTARTAIDHVAHTSTTEVLNPTYHQRLGDIVLAGPHADRPISDHAALTFDIRRR